MKIQKLFLILVSTITIYLLFSTPIPDVENKETIIQMKPEIPLGSKREVKIPLPAVDEEGKGTIVWLRVEVLEGEGRILLEINNILFWEDTQESVRLAKSIAEELSDVDTKNYDIIYSIDANASKIEGPSAGPAMAIATILALENKTINNSVVISGYLRKDGKIGKVSGILSKARAAKENGFKLFLIPKDQSYQLKTETEKKCFTEGLTTICRTESFTERVNIKDEIGIDVIEVENISEALKYFIIE